MAYPFSSMTSFTSGGSAYGFHLWWPTYELHLWWLFLWVSPLVAYLQASPLVALLMGFTSGGLLPTSFTSGGSSYGLHLWWPSLELHLWWLRSWASPLVANLEFQLMSLLRPSSLFYHFYHLSIPMAEFFLISPRLGCTRSDWHPGLYLRHTEVSSDVSRDSGPQTLACRSGFP
jgi:hypothetical protein